MLYERLKGYAKQNRKHPTQAEDVIWTYLKCNALGVPFRRQHIIGDYIADFFCLPARLIIEIDGGYHTLPECAVSDAIRTQWLESMGYRLIRFKNEEVICDIERVLEDIKKSVYDRETKS